MSVVAMSGDMRDPKPGHIWRSADGTINGTMRFGDESWPYLMFDSSAEARAHAAAAIAIAEAMERLEAAGGTALPAEGEGGDGK